MSEPTIFRAVWIDDDLARADSWKGGLVGSLLGKEVEIELDTFEVTAKLIDEISVRLVHWTTTPPDLIIIDQKFTMAGQLPFDLHGSGLAHLLRLQLPRTPIVCVSAQKLNSDDFNMEDLSEYTYLFSVSSLSETAQQERLFSIAQDFRKLCFNPKTPVREQVIDALLPPSADREALLSVLPDEFESDYVHGTTPHRIARWILNVLMLRPGFLWDPLDAGTFVGLTESAFIRCQEHFESALYKGPFATETRPLWWASEVTDALYKAIPDFDHLPPSQAGRHLPTVTDADFSKCLVSTGIPDVVVYADMSMETRYAVCRRFATQLSDAESAVPGFPPRLKLVNLRKDDGACNS